MAEEIIVKSPYPEIEPVVNHTVPQFIWSQLNKWPKAICLECGISGKQYTYEEIFTLSRRFAAGLKSNGLKTGDVIGIVLPNCPEFAITLLGCWEAGCVASPVNPAYSPSEIIQQLKGSGSMCAITIEPFIPVVKAAKESLKGVLETIIIVSPDAHEGCVYYPDMISKDTVIEFSDGKCFDTTTTTAILPYSSGTTGLPKGVMLTHTNICTNIVQYTQPDIGTTHFFEGGKEQEVLIGLLPFFHVYGLTAILLSGMYQGCKIVTLPKFVPAVFIKTIKTHKPTAIHVVTPLINFIVNNSEFNEEAFERCHSVLAGAAPVGVSLIKRLLEKAGRFMDFQEGYGMTELSPITHGVNPSLKHTKLGSIGRLLPSTWAKVIDIESGKTLGPNENGEMCIKGPQVMKGYFQNEEATLNTIDKDGFLHTGDIVSYDEDGCFYIKDRLKELIKVKGFQVAPSELENVLRDLPGVADVAVIGVPFDNDEAPRAYIVRSSEVLCENDVHEFIKEKVAKFKKLKGGIEFVQAIPRASSGKILRRELQKDYKEKNIKN